MPGPALETQRARASGREGGSGGGGGEGGEGGGRRFGWHKGASELFPRSRNLASCIASEIARSQRAATRSPAPGRRERRGAARSVERLPGRGKGTWADRGGAAAEDDKTFVGEARRRGSLYRRVLSRCGEARLYRDRASAGNAFNRGAPGKKGRLLKGTCVARKGPAKTDGLALAMIDR
jgi:hypothetical protein